jgi:hypothetical protein
MTLIKLLSLSDTGTRLVSRVNELRSSPWNIPTTNLVKPPSRHRIKQKHRMGKPQTAQAAISDEKTFSFPRQPSEDSPRVDDTRVFACPFWRVNPSGNTDCLILKLSRPRDVKQHLQRRHFHSTPPCPKCKRQFPSMEAFNDHVKFDQCTLVQVDSHFYTQSVPLELQEELKKPSRKSLDQEEQWYAIWSLLFPNLSPPKTPYLDTILEEAVGVVQIFWDQEGSDFSESFLKKNPDAQMNTEQLRSLLSGFLGHIKTRIHEEGAEVVKTPQGSKGVMDIALLQDISTLDGGSCGGDVATATKELGGSRPFTFIQDPHLQVGLFEDSRAFIGENSAIDLFHSNPDSWRELSNFGLWGEHGVGMDWPQRIKEEWADG